MELSPRDVCPAAFLPPLSGLGLARWLGQGSHDWGYFWAAENPARAEPAPALRVRASNLERKKQKASEGKALGGGGVAVWRKIERQRQRARTTALCAPPSCPAALPAASHPAASPNRHRKSALPSHLPRGKPTPLSPLHTLTPGHSHTCARTQTPPLGGLPPGAPTLNSQRVPGLPGASLGPGW